MFAVLLQSTFPTIVSGQVLTVTFSPLYDFAFRQGAFSPVCRIHRLQSPEKNFAGRCEMSGLALRITVNEDIAPGYLYEVTLSGLRNPDSFDQRAA